MNSRPAVRRFILALALTVMLPAAALAQARILALEEAIETAYANHPQMQASQYALEVAQANVGVARGGFLPTLDFVAAYSRGTGNLVPTPGAEVGTPEAILDDQGNVVGFTAGNTINNTSYNFFNIGLELVQPIWDFGRTLGAYDASKAESEAAEKDVQAIRLLTRFRVVVAYYGVLAAQEMVAVAQRTRDQTRLFAERAQGMYDVGARPRIDVVRTEADALAAEAALLAAGETLKLASYGLLAAMGTTERFEFEVVRPAVQSLGTPPPLDEAVSDALETRPDRAAAKARVEAVDSAVVSAEGEYYPTLAANASFRDGGIEIDNMVWNWQVGVGLTFPILSFARTMYAVRAAKAGLRAAEAGLKGMDLAIRTEVEQARARVVETSVRISPVKAALAASKEALHFALERYKVGEGGQVELLDAQRAFADAEATLVRAEYDLALAWATFWYSIGKIPDPAEGTP